MAHSHAAGIGLDAIRQTLAHPSRAPFLRDSIVAALVASVTMLPDGVPRVPFLQLVVSSWAMKRLMESMRETSAVPRYGDQAESTRRGYGDQMALNGEVMNLWRPLGAMVAFLSAFSALTSLATGCSLWTVPGYYAAGLLAFYLWHLAAHHTKGEMHRIHMVHHHHSFPPRDFYGDVTRAVRRFYPNGTPTLLDLLNPFLSTTSSWHHEGPLAVGMFLILAIGRQFIGTSSATTAFVLAGYIIMALLGSALHISFHIRGFELEPYAWYRELRTVHYLHHLDDVNFAMVNVFIDVLFGTLKGCVTRPYRLELDQ